MPTLEEQVRGLSPAAMRIFKQQLPQRLKELSALERNTALSQLQRIPGLLEIEAPVTQPQQPQVEPEKKWWDYPLDWIRNVETGAGTLLAAPFTPSVPGTEQLPWWEKERAEYEAWEEPGFQTQPLFRLPWTPQEIRDKPWMIGAKGALEFTPWIATTLATAGLGGMAGLGARTGLTGLTRAAALGQRAIKPIIAVERAMAYPITKPLEMAAKKILPKVAEQVARLLPDLQPIDEAITIATQPSILRRLVNINIKGHQPLKGIAEVIGGRAATADNPAKLALVGRDVMRFEGANKATAAIATLNRMGKSKDIFNLTDEGFMRVGKAVPTEGKIIPKMGKPVAPEVTEPALGTLEQERIRRRLMSGEKVSQEEEMLLSPFDFMGAKAMAEYGFKVPDGFVVQLSGYNKDGTLVVRVIAPTKTGGISPVVFDLKIGESFIDQYNTALTKSEALTAKAVAAGKKTPQKPFMGEQPTPTPPAVGGAKVNEAIPIAGKWEKAKARNSTLAQKDLDNLKAKGYEIDDAQDTLTTFKETIRKDFDTAEEFAEARTDAWDEFVNAVDSIEGLEAAIPKPPAVGAVPEVASVVGKGLVHLNDIRTYPQRYTNVLNDTQKAWIEQATLLEREKAELFARNGIKIRQLTFEEGGEYAGRRVFAKFDAEGNLLDVGYIGRGQPGKPGIMTAQEKTRIFKDATEATEMGYRYLPEEEALYYNIIGAYNRIGDKQFADWFLSKVPWRTTAVAGDIAEANLTMKGTRSALKQMQSAAMRWRTGEKIPPQLLLGIKKYYPKEYETIKLAFKEGTISERKSLAESLLTFIRKEELANKKQWAQIKYDFKVARSEAMRPGFSGTMAPDIPAFAGKVFTGPEAKEWVNIIRSELNPSFNSALHAINQVNAVGRYFALAGDISPGFIQLIFMMGSNPIRYAKSMGGFVKALFDPLYHDNLLAKNIELIQRHPGLILTKGAATEMTEAMGRGGLLRKGPFKLGGKVLEPFQRGFESALDTAGIELSKAFDYLCTTPARTAQVDAFINEFRGLLSTTKIGINSTQRQLERALILAPQYNRGIGALIWDVAQGLVGAGGLRGKLARESMAKGVSAIAAMTVAVSHALGETEEEIIEHLNPMSSNFMTWDIAGQRVGPGSKVRSLLYLYGKIAKNPEDASYLAGRFIRGNFSPFVGTSMDILTGKDYMGDPTRDGLPNLTKTLLAENLLPIWVQSVALEGGDFADRTTRGVAEFMGMRGYPAGAYTGVKELQDKLAQQKHGLSWDELGMKPEGMALQMRITRESPELQELSSKAAKESEKWARGEQLVWNEYGREVDKIGNVVTSELKQASLQFEATRDGTRLRERVNQAYWLKSQMMRELLNQEQFVIVKEQFETPLTEEARAEMQPQKLLYRDYNEFMYAEDMFDQFGEYQFDEANRRRQIFIQRYGLDALNAVEMVIGERRADEPDAVKLLRQAREILKPYWEIESSMWARYPAQLKQVSDQILQIERTNPQQAKAMLFRYPQIVAIRTQIAKYKKLVKERNPQVAQALQMFYSY